VKAFDCDFFVQLNSELNKFPVFRESLKFLAEAVLWLV